ncbi:MAG: YihY/virulence factor BrkB family protein [Deferribacteraceae bacterium]|jgi:YihY family inner membrane protein|nr:YihY/virulence factor BrkB family protein [Deferribacteraceae bacterium]
MLIKCAKYLWNLALLGYFIALRFSRHSIGAHSASCTYYFLVSAVPVVALTSVGATLLVSKLAAFGIKGNMRLFENIELYVRIKSMVDSLGVPETTSLRAIGIVGLIFLMWYASSLLRDVSRTFNIIFSMGVSRKGIARAAVSYIMIPLILIIAILFSSLSKVIVMIFKWLLADALQLVTKATFFSWVTPIVSGIFIMLAAFVCFIMLPPYRPKPAKALKGATLFAIYFIGLQTALGSIMVNLIESYSKYGALGGLLMLLLWALLVFYGLFTAAEYVNVSGHYGIIKFASYIGTNMKKPTLVEKLLFQKIPFADDEYLKQLASGDIVEHEGVSCCIVRSGKVIVRRLDKTWELSSGGVYASIYAADKIEIEAQEPSEILTVREDDFYAVWEQNPELWRAISRSIKLTEGRHA